MKPRLVLVHGWAVNSLIWNPILERLRSSYDVTILDLPGYGKQIDYSGDYDIQALAANVLSGAPETANWVAWSLGGTIALWAALAQPHRFESLQLISTTPQFLAGEQWEYGIEPGPFEELSLGFEADFSKSLKKFLLLQTFTEDPKEKKRSVSLVRKLHTLLTQADQPSQRTLRSGLAILSQTDLRQRLGELKVETQVVAGRSDRIVPLSASRYLFEQLPNRDSFVSLPGSHLPFLEHPSDYIECLEKFIPTNSAGAS